MGQALGQVRRLAEREADSVMIVIALEGLVEAAKHADHKDAPLYEKILKACRQREDDPALGALCLQLIGSSEDEKVSQGLMKWLKNKKLLSSEKKKAQSATPAPTPNPPSSASFAAPSPFFYPYPPSPWASSGPPPYSYPPGGPYGGDRPGQAGGRRRPQGSGPRLCFVCRQPGHIADSCPSVKKEK